MMHKAMILRSTLFRNNKAVSHVSNVTSCHHLVPCRGMETELDHSNYGSKDGKDLLFHHQHFARPMKPLQKMNVLPRKKFEPEVFYLLEERFKELDPALHEPEFHKPVNIGFSSSECLAQRRRKERLAVMELKKNKVSANLMKNKEWKVDVGAVQKDYLCDMGPSHIRILAHHCNIFKDLFGPYAFFDPLVPLAVEYDCDEETFSPVYRGNIIKPREATTAPSVGYPSPADGFWTVILTNPDGDLYKKDSECIHWMVTNIKGNDISSGEEVVPYLPPVPPHGVGYQRMVFVLYRQHAPLSDSQRHSIHDPHDLRLRSFSTENFYRTHETSLTPAGLAWYNTDWDSSLTEYYHDVLGMKEPRYEYEFPTPFVNKEVAFPKERNFVNYIDLYRDPKDISQEMLLKRLSRLNPLKKEAHIPFPDMIPINHNLPSWIRQEIKLERREWGKYRDLYRHDYDTVEETEACLQDAVTVEVEKSHTLRIGSEWQKLRLGKKKLKAAAKSAEEAADIKED